MTKRRDLCKLKSLKLTNQALVQEYSKIDNPLKYLLPGREKCRCGKIRGNLINRLVYIELSIIYLYNPSILTSLKFLHLARFTSLAHHSLSKTIKFETINWFWKVISVYKGSMIFGCLPYQTLLRTQ